MTDLQNAMENTVQNRNISGSKQDPDRKLIDKIENHYKNTITTICSKLQHVSTTIDKYGTQLNAQLSHSNKIQSYLKQLMSSNETEEKLIKLQSERYALYEYIHSIKHQTDNVPFNINNLQKEMGLDSIYDEENRNKPRQISTIDPKIFNKLQSENDKLKQNLTSMLSAYFCIFFHPTIYVFVHSALRNWKNELSKQLTDDDKQKSDFEDDQNRIRELENKLANANKKASIYKERLEQIKELRKQGKLKINTSPTGDDSDEAIQNLNVKVAQLIKENESLQENLEGIKSVENGKQSVMKETISKLQGKMKELQQNHNDNYNRLQMDYNKVVSENEEFEKQIESFKNGQSEQRGSILALKSLLTESNEDCKHLEQELNDKETKMKQLQQEFEMVQQSNIDDMTALKDQIQTLQTTNTSITQQMEQMHTKLEQTETNRDDKVTEYKDKIKELSMLNEELMIKCDEIEKDRNKKQRQSEQEQETTTLELSRFKRKSESLKNEIEEVTQEWQDKTVKLKKEYDKIISDLENKCKKLKQQHQNANKDNIELQKRFEEYKLKQTDIKQRLEKEYNTDMILLKAEKESLYKQLDKYKSNRITWHELDEENKRLNKQVNDHILNCVSEREKLQQKVDHLLNEKKELNQTINVWEMKYDTLEKKRISEETKLRNSIIEISSQHQDKVNQFITDNKDYVAQIDEHQQTICLLKESLNQKDDIAKQEKEALESKIKEIERKYDESLEKLKTMISKFNQEKASLQSSHQLKIGNLDDKMTSLEKQLETQKQANTDLQDKTQRLNEEKLTLVQEIKSKTAQFDTKNSEIIDRDRSYQARINELQSRLNDKNDQILSLESKCKDIAEKTESLTAQNNELKTTLQTFDKEKEALNSEITKMNGEVDGLRTSLFSARSELISSTIQIDRKDSDIKKMKEQIDELLQSENHDVDGNKLCAIRSKSVSNTISLVEDTKKSNVNTIEQYEDRINILTAENEGLDDELSKLRVDYEELQSEMIKLQGIKNKQDKKLKSAKKECKKLKQRRDTELDEFKNKVKDLTQRLSIADDIESKSRRSSMHNNARLSVLKAQTKNLRIEHSKYTEFIDKLCAILNHKDKENLVELLEICKHRLMMESESEGSYRKLYEIANKSCDNLLSFINQKSLDLNNVVNSLSKATMKYDYNINEQGLNVIELKIPLSLITHIALQLITKDTTIEKKVNASIKLFYKSAWRQQIEQNKQSNDWIQYGSDQEQKRRITKIQNISLRKLRLYPFFTDKIKLEIICPNTNANDTNKEIITFAINILGKHVIFG